MLILDSDSGQISCQNFCDGRVEGDAEVSSVPGRGQERPRTADPHAVFAVGLRDAEPSAIRAVEVTVGVISGLCRGLQKVLDYFRLPGESLDRQGTAGSVEVGTDASDFGVVLLALEDWQYLESLVNKIYE